MDKRLNNIVDNLDTMKIEVVDSFKFHCTMCGKCCINRDDILLTPKDIFNMAQELRATPWEMYVKYCETYIGGDSRMPLVRLKPHGLVKRCPLLKDHKCSIHKAKPSVCAMFPIGRYIKIESDRQSSEDIIMGKPQFIFTNPGCGDDTETHTVQEWLSESGIPVEDEFFRKWIQTIYELGTIFRDAEKTQDGSIMELAWKATFVILYLSYDMGQTFLPQFEKNAENIKELIHRMSKGEGGAQDE